MNNDIEFNYFLEVMTDEEKAEFYADDPFNDDEDRYYSRGGDSISEDDIIEFIFDDFFE